MKPEGMNVISGVLPQSKSAAVHRGKSCLELYKALKKLRIAFKASNSPGRSLHLEEFVKCEGL